MRSFRRDTAEAFGDEPDRDIEADFGAPSSSSALAAAMKAVKGGASTVATRVGGKLVAKAPAKPASASVKVQGPSLAVVASGARLVPPKPASTPKAPTVKVSAKAKVVTTAKPTSSAPAKAAGASTAQQGNFLDGGAPIAAPAVKVAAGTVTMTQAQRDANARALVAEASRKLAAQNAGYQATRAADQKLSAETHARLLATNPTYAARERYIHSAGLDTAQITMGAKVIAVGAAVIASGGAVAGAVGVTTGGAALASAAAADRLVAAVEKGGELGKKASSVISDVKAAAAKGDAIAKEAIGTIEAVAKERIEAAVPRGVEQALTGAAKDAANAVASVAASLSGSGSLNLGSLSASLSAAGGKAPSSTGYSTSAALTGGGKRRVAAVSSQGPAKQLSQFDAGAGLPRWLVTPEGRVVDLNRSPAKADDRGYLVTTGGEVSKQ